MRLILFWILSIQLAGVFAPPAFAQIGARMQAALEDHSPCILAGRLPAMPPRYFPHVLCIMEKFEAGQQKCVSTGYHTERDIFTSNLGISAEVPQACEKGGFEALLETTINGKKLREILIEGFYLEFAAERRYIEWWPRDNPHVNPESKN